MVLALVGGAANTKARKSYTGVKTLKAGGYAHAGVPERKKLPMAETKEVRPEQLIPLNDDEFQDF